MWQLQAFLSLPSAERRALLTAGMLVVLTRLGMWLLPFSALRSLLDRSSCRAVVPLPPERLAWCVEVASRYVPVATCLTQALAARWLLQQHGYGQSTLRIGVARGLGGAFQAHAWVELAGQIVIGGSAEEVQRFTLLPSLEKAETE